MRFLAHVICFLCKTRLRETVAAAQALNPSGPEANEPVYCPVCLAPFRHDIDVKRLFMTFSVGPADQEMSNSIAMLVCVRSEPAESD